MKKILYHSPFGPLGLISYQGCLIYCNWISDDCKFKKDSIEKLIKIETESPEDVAVLKQTIGQLNEYFLGSRHEFHLPLKLIGTPFQRTVWNLISSVAYGSTITYKELTELYENPKAIRAVAQACGANPIAVIIPCHRIVATNGKTGGYTGGLDKKIALLSLENK